MDTASIISVLGTALGSIGCEAGSATDQPTVIVPRDRLLETCRAVRDDPALGFTVLVDLTAVDWWPREPRFSVVYHLIAPERPARLRLEVHLPGEEAHVRTVEPIWPSAGWLEREVWDLFGVVFDEHPDLRRLMMPEDWDGHPLRKDHPVQIRMKPKVYEPLQLTEAEFRANIVADRHTRRDEGPDSGVRG